MTNPDPDDFEGGREWPEAWSPPPWNAVQEEETGLWQVVCDGYNDETPIVCAGTQSWPLIEADAHILAAALDLLELARKARQKLATYVSVYPGDKELIGLLTAWDEAIAKADGKP